MRKAALVVGGGIFLLLLVPAVRGKEEPGSRQTFSQRVNSLFGLIDRGESAPPPPPPPDMPNYARRTPHQTVQQGGSRPQTSYEPRPGAAAAAAAQGAGAKPLPPLPQRDDGFATADDVPPEQTMPNLGGPQVQRPALLERSRSSATGGAFTSRTAAGPAQSAPVARSGNAAPSYSSQPQTNSRPAATSGFAAQAPAAVAQGDGRSAGGAPALPAAVLSSRRRSSESSGDLPVMQAPAAAQAPANAAPQVTPIPTPIPIQTGSTSVRGSEAFVPETPFTADSRSSRPHGDLPPAHGKPEPASIPTLNAPPTLKPAGADAAPLTQTPSPASVEPAATPNLGVAETPTPALTSNGPTTIAPQTSVENHAIAIPSDSSRRAAVLSAFDSPEITVETLGPQRISIGRESTYRVVVRNRGTTEARQLVVSLGVPQWAEIAELHGTAGSTTSADEHASGEPLEWRIDALAARAEEELTLVIIPRRSETFDLQVGWTCSPGIAVAAIEVEEPQLQMAISGPTEVSYGEQRLYKLTVSNPGTGTAENVELQLLPLAPGDGDPVAHRIGSLKAGDSLSVEVELTARQAGRLQIRTEAIAAGGLKSSAVADVVVHRPALEVAVAAPKMLFAGVPGNYEVRVRNTGDDHARNVRVSVLLPQASKLLNAGPTPRSDSGGELIWTLDRLPAGAEQVYTIRCALGQGGTQQLSATASADGDLRKSAQAVTSVQAVADLVLDVIDAPGPIAIGQPITYEIHVKNRGMKSAEKVDVVAFFSEGIEPEKAEGQAHEMQPGMVVFETMPTIGAAQEKIIKVTARATAAGNHRLRVELHSANPQTDLSQEDSTFFYADEAPTTTSSNGPAAGSPAVVITTTTSTGPRYAEPAAPGIFTPVNSAPINVAASAGVTNNANPAPIAVVAPPQFSDNRYGPAPAAAGVQQAGGQANAPAVIYPAAMPPRVFNNGLR